MKNFIKKILLFSIVSILLYVCLIYVWGKLIPKQFNKNLINKIGGYGQTYSRLKEVKEYSEVDVLFLGSSHTYRSFDTRIFEQDSISSFNLGSNAQTPLQTEVLLKRYLKKLNPKLVVFEVYPGNFSRDGVESSLDIISNDYLDANILKTSMIQKNIKIYNSIIFNFFSELSNQKQTFRENIIKGNDTYIKGGFVEKEISYFKNINHKKSTWELEQNQLKAFERCVKLIKNNNSKLIFVQAPITSSYYKAHSNNSYFDSIMNTYGIYINFNEKLTLNDSLDFYDYHHLNQNGVKIFDEALLPIIKLELK